MHKNISEITLYFFGYVVNEIKVDLLLFHSDRFVMFTPSIILLFRVKHINKGSQLERCSRSDVYLFVT